MNNNAILIKNQSIYSNLVCIGSSIAEATDAHKHEPDANPFKSDIFEILVQAK